VWRPSLSAFISELLGQGQTEFGTLYVVRLYEFEFLRVIDGTISLQFLTNYVPFKYEIQLLRIDLTVPQHSLNKGRSDTDSKLCKFHPIKQI
jgi:hypothetical protein